MDISVPGMDGLETTRCLRGRERERGVRPVWIVGVTTHAFEDYVEACRVAGMDEYLAKPCRRQRLFDLLETRPAGNLIKSAILGDCGLWGGDDRFPLG